LYFLLYDKHNVKTEEYSFHDDEEFIALAVAKQSSTLNNADTAGSHPDNHPWRTVCEAV